MPDNTIGGKATTETVRIAGHHDDEIPAYLAHPPGRGPFAGVVVLHHMPGYDEATKQITEIFAANGYTAILPNLHWRDAPGASPDDAAAAVRAAGGVPDERLVGDVDGAARYLRSLDSANGKVGVIGYCSGGRQAFLAACPLLGLFGAEDTHPSPAETARLEQELTRLGKTFELHTHPGAGHGFFAADRPSYRPEAAADGWQRIWDWFGRHLAA